MSPEKKTKEHSVLSAIKNQKRNILEMQDSIAKEKAIQEGSQFDEQTYLENNFGFMGDALAQVGEFKLKPSDILHLWSETSELFSYYQRHALSGMISAAYCVQHFPNTDWQMFPRIYNSGINNIFEFLTEINPTDKELQTILSRYQDISTSIYELQQMNRSLAEEGSPDPIISEAVENFGNGMNSIKMIFDYFQDSF
jgi:hypothetical protein